MESATAPEIELPPHPLNSKEYYLAGWDKDFSCVTENLAVKAIIAERLRTFIVTFINGDETTTQTIAYGSDATLPEPYKSDSGRYIYTFVCWDKADAHLNVTEDVTITALFEIEYLYYIVTFLDGNDSILDEQSVYPTEDATEPLSIPTKAKSDDQVFEFIGCDKGFT